MNKKVINIQDHKEIAQEINDIIDRLSSLSAKISNCGGKTTMRSTTNKLDKTREVISDIRFIFENLMLKDYPDAPLYTSYRNYRSKGRRTTLAEIEKRTGGINE